MAAAVSPRPSGGFDLHTSAPYPIRLGRNLPSCSSVQYNHKPDLSDHEEAETTILPARNGKQATLTLKDGDDKYVYSGRQDNNAEDAYVLVLDDATNEFSLERLTSSYAFNLTRAPWESDAEVLAERYPQLSADEHGEDVFGDADDLDLDADADADNPFDFRHYLDKVDSPSPNLHPTKNALSSTPAVSQSSTRTSTPLARSARKQTSAFAPQAAKPPPKPRSKPKPVESQPQPQTSTRSPSPDVHLRKESSDVPSVRIDRRASTRIALPPQPASRKQQPRETEELSLDDDGDLILEGDDPPRSSYHAKSSLGLVFANQLGEGPRSLRSAASSPAASHINSPAPRRPSPLSENQNGHSDGEDFDIDMDQEEDADIESDVDDDDVDALQLPSPAQAHRPSISGATVTGDDDDDLEKQMLLELEGSLNDHGPSGQQGGAESDEESEEE